jgi:hypothetical protein
LKMSGPTKAYQNIYKLNQKFKTVAGKWAP